MTERGVITAATEATGIALAGLPGAPAIVFVHGTRMTSAMWSAQMIGLGDTFRTIALDLPGHGTRAGAAFTLEGASESVAAAIREYATGGRAVVVGLSLGGYVAMDLAAREPTLVRGLVLSGATAEPIGLRTLPYLGLARVTDQFSGTRGDRLNGWFFRKRYPAEIADPILVGGFWPIGGAAALRAIVGESFLSRLAAYPGPTLLINGEFDYPFRLSARRFASVASDARRVRLAGASHLANLDRPAAFNAAVRRFATSLEDD